MTLDEMKLAVCEKLPELMWIDKAHSIYWQNQVEELPDEEINWPTEGLQVCHEAEKLLEQNQYEDFVERLLDNVDETTCDLNPERATFMIINATYEQRLEALCRVWFPERFS